LLSADDKVVITLFEEVVDFVNAPSRLNTNHLGVGLDKFQSVTRFVCFKRRDFLTEFVQILLRLITKCSH